MIFSAAILFDPRPALPKQLIIDSDKQLEFARTYMQEGEYQKAVIELERFIHFFPDEPQIPLARYLVGVCHLHARQYEAARAAFYEAAKEDPQAHLAGKALLLMGETYFQQGVWKEAEHYFTRVAQAYPHVDVKNAARYRLGWTNLQENRWTEASQAFGSVEKGSLLYGSAQQLAKESHKGETLPRKSPVTGGTLAALVPGLGHAYAGRYKDAAVAFVLNGLFIWATVESFHQDHDVLGGVLSFLEMGWYGGNIYSAVNVCHRYNRMEQVRFRSDLDDHFEDEFSSSGDSPVGFAFTFPF